METPILRITIGGAKGLGGKETAENCYCSLTCYDSEGHHIKGSKKKTKSVKKNQNEWNETFEFALNNPSIVGIKIKVKHRGTLGNSTVGGLTLPIDKLNTPTETEELMTVLDGKSRETGKISIRYIITKSSPKPVVATPVTSPDKKSLQKSERRTKKLNKIFNGIPPEEKVQYKIGCAMDSSNPHHGNLYITQHFIFFYAKGTKISIRLIDLSAIEKKPALMVPTAIKFTTHDKKEYIFGNFKHRDRVLQVLQGAREAVLNESLSQHPPPVLVSPARGSLNQSSSMEAPSATDVSETEADDLSEADFLTTDDDEIIKQPYPVSTTSTTYTNPNTPVHPSTVSVLSSNNTPSSSVVVNKVILKSSSSEASSNPNSRRGSVDESLIPTIVSLQQNFANTYSQNSATSTTVVTSAIPIGSGSNAPADEVRGGNVGEEKDNPQYSLSPKDQPLRQRKREPSGGTNSLTSSAGNVVTAPPALLGATQNNVNSSNVTTTTTKEISSNSTSVLPSSHSTSSASPSPSRGTSSSVSPSSATVQALKTRLSPFQQQIVEMHYLTFVSLLTLLLFAEGNLFTLVMAASIMGTLMAIVQPGVTSSALYSFIVAKFGRNKIESKLSTSLGLKVVLSTIVTVPLLMVAYELTPHFAMGWFWGLLSAVLIGGFAYVLETQMGMINSTTTTTSVSSSPAVSKAAALKKKE